MAEHNQSDCPVHVFFVHSPITYTLARAVMAGLGEEKAILIGARHMQGDGFAAVLPSDGGWSVPATCQLLQTIAMLVGPDRPIVLYLPHTASLFGKLVFASRRIVRFYYLEEGFGAAQPHMQLQFRQPGRIDLAALQVHLHVLALMHAFALDESALAALNEPPVVPYDGQHPAYAGSFAVSPDAFPGMRNVVRIGLAAAGGPRSEAMVAIMGLFNHFDHDDQRAGACQYILGLLRDLADRIEPGQRLLAKLHPRDRAGLPGWFYTGLENLAQNYEDFCRHAGLDANLEPALHQFNHYWLIGESAMEKYVTLLLGADRVTKLN